MKKFVLNLSILFAVLLTVTACNSVDEKNPSEQAEEKNEQKFDDNKMEDDREFAVEAASDGMMEIEMGKLAMTNASSAKVKEYAKMIVDDHTGVNQKLKDLAAQKSISLPETMDEKHREHLKDLSEKKGMDFDKAYLKMMIDDHEADIKNFEKEAEKGNDPDIKAFAANTLPALKKHLETAKSMHDAIKDNKENGKDKKH